VCVMIWCVCLLRGRYVTGMFMWVWRVHYDLVRASTAGTLCHSVFMLGYFIQNAEVRGRHVTVIKISLPF
jgi:hypothetical protein